LRRSLERPLAAKNAVRTAAISLQQAMGLPPQAEFPIQDVTVATDAAVPALDDCLAQAKTLRPDVRGVKAGVDSAKTSVKTAKIEMYPRTVVTGELNQDFTGQSDRTIAVSAGLAFDLFNGGNNKAVYDEARANLAGAEIRAAQLDKDIAAQVQTAYLNLTDAQERMKASEFSVKSAQRNLDVQQERYQQGMAIPLTSVRKWFTGSLLTLCRGFMPVWLDQVRAKRKLGRELAERSAIAAGHRQLEAQRDPNSAKGENKPRTKPNDS
jgi:outer membrane protein TolC